MTAGITLFVASFIYGLRDGSEISIWLIILGISLMCFGFYGIIKSYEDLKENNHD